MMNGCESSSALEVHSYLLYHKDSLQNVNKNSLDSPANNIITLHVERGDFLGGLALPGATVSKGLHLLGLRIKFRLKAVLTA